MPGAPNRARAKPAHRPGSALVATAAGQPLYSSLGFVTVAESAWYRFRTPAGPTG